MRAVVLLNMGAPRDLDEVEVFLINMFKDKNILTIKSDFARSILAHLITFMRKNEAKENYKKIGSISPLVNETKKLERQLQAIYPSDIVTSIMRYTPPFADDVIKELKLKGIKELVVLPLYPHYSTTTVKSSLEDLYHALKKNYFDPYIKSIQPYYKNRLYNLAIIETIREKAPNNTQECDLIFSAHSLPQKIIDAGDSYQKEVEDHVKILKELLDESGLKFREYHLAYQSKLGPIKWLEPSLESKLRSLTSNKALIVPISFSLDNSETIFELDIEYRELSKELRYQFYEVAKAPNAKTEAISAYQEMIDG